MCLSFKLILSIVLVKAVVGDVSHVYGQPQQYLPAFQQLDAQYPSDEVQYSVPEHEGYPSGQPELDNALYEVNGYPDPVQQYANSYNPEGGVEADADAGLAGGLDGFGGIGGPSGPSGPGGPGGPLGGPGGAFGGPGGPGLGFGPYGGLGPFGGPGAFGIQSGYEGFLVPSFGPGPFGPIGPPPPPPPAFFGPGPFTGLSSILPQQKTIISFIGRILSLILGMFGMTVVGGGITTAICTFTPLCTISFALPFLGVRSAAQRLIDAIDLTGNTGERVARTAEFVQTAIEKFQKIQNEGNEEQKQVEAVEKEEEKALS